jgi:hypothetical protein
MGTSSSTTTTTTTTTAATSLSLSREQLLADQAAGQHQQQARDTMLKLVGAPCRHHSYNYREETNKLIRGGGEQNKKLEESQREREREREAEG